MAVQRSDVDLIQCQKISILCFVSTKYISFVTEYIVSMAVQRSDVDLIQCHKNLYFVFRFDKIYLFCHGIHRLYGSSTQRC